jgi:hypothetical protein
MTHSEKIAEILAKDDVLTLDEANVIANSIRDVGHGDLNEILIAIACGTRRVLPSDHAKLAAIIRGMLTAMEEPT